MFSDPNMLETRPEGGHSRNYRFRRGQSGQTTVFLALSMMVLICFLAFMVDVGQLVHDRILTQNVADMVALSAANVQAAGMNELADLNWEYRRLQEDLLDYLTYQPYIDRGEVEGLVADFKEWMELVRGYMLRANQVFPVLAELAAYRTLDWYNDTYGNHFELVGIVQNRPLTTLEHTMPEMLHSTYLEEPRNPPPIPAYIFTGIRCVEPIQVMSAGVPAPFFDVLDKPYMKKSDGTLTYMVVHVRRQARPVFVNLPAFGYDVEIPRIDALAGLIPTGGHIERGEPEYFARYAPLEHLGFSQFRH